MKEEIEALIQIHGEMGVNAIARALNSPVSTVQKFLERQDYFVKTVNRKWNTPDRILEGIEKETLQQEAKETESVIGEIEAGLDALQLRIDALKLKLPVVNASIKRLTVANQLAGVADVPNTRIYNRIKDFYLKVETQRKIIGRNIDKVPDKYKDLLANLDYLRLTLIKGSEFVDNVINHELTALILGEKTELDNSITEILAAYQSPGKTSGKVTESLVSDDETPDAEHSPTP